MPAEDPGAAAPAADAIPGLLERLLRTPGPSGAEHDVAAVWRDAVAPAADELETLALGTVRATRRGRDGHPHVALFTHIDEIGLIVRAITPEGFLIVDGIGGWDPQILVGQRVRFITASGPVPGVIGRTAIHLLEREAREKVVAMKDLRIDIGARDGEDARSRIEVGDAGVIDADPLLFPHGRIVSRALDNRVSAYVAATVLARLAGGEPLGATVTAVASVQEETSLAGARTAGYGVAPDLAIVLDVTHASDAPGVGIEAEGEHPLGTGPVIVRGPGSAPALVERLRAVAREANIPHTIMAEGGLTATDADAVHVGRAGIPTAVVSIPLRYMHSPVEMVDLADLEHTVGLLVACLAGF